jgi:adenine-specific DNA-methyltransferase
MEKKMQKMDAIDKVDKSADLVAANIEQLKMLFPELVIESSGGATVNVDVLKALVGDRTGTDSDEKYGLNWHGKRRARQLALTPSTATLRPCPDESVDWDTTKNLMIEGDNLEVLKLLQKSYAGRVKLIYIDPPYNTGNDFVYPDDFRDSIRNYKLLTGQLDDEGRARSTNSEASGRFHTDWLSMIYPRLKLARNLLRSDGVLFITIDDHEVAQLIQVCDEIFGEENRKGLLVWQHSLQPKGYSGTFSVHHNYVLCYQKSEDFELANMDRTEEHNRSYSNPDNDPRGAWRTGDVRNAMYRPNLIYPITTPSGNTIEPPANGWRWSKETVASKIASGEIVFSEDESRIIRKIYLDTLDGRTPETILFGKEVGTTRDATGEIKSLFDNAVPFDTPKPTGLIRHLITLAGAREQDIVMDFFAGSGTTAHAVMAYNAESGTRLRSIMVQLPEPLDLNNKDQKEAAAYCARISKPATIAELTKERLRRVSAQLRTSGALLAGDVGFRVMRLDDSNIRKWSPDRDDLSGSLFASEDHVLPNRTDADILAELTLKWGLDLCVPTEQRLIAGCSVYAIGAGVLLVCLATSITDEQTEALGAGMIDWRNALGVAGQTTCIFRDDSFADDVVKVNLAAILHQGGIDNVRSL